MQKQPDLGLRAIAGQERAFTWDFQAYQPPSTCTAAGIALLHHGGTISTNVKNQIAFQNQADLFSIVQESTFSRDLVFVFFF